MRPIFSTNSTGQQKMFATQVFELHQLLKVQKLIAMSSNLPLEDNAYESMPVCTSEEQCVPTIDPGKFPKSSVAYFNHNSEITINKWKLDSKEASRHSSIPYRQRQVQKLIAML